MTKLFECQNERCQELLVSPDVDELKLCPFCASGDLKERTDVELQARFIDSTEILTNGQILAQEGGELTVCLFGPKREGAVNATQALELLDAIAEAMAYWSGKGGSANDACDSIWSAMTAAGFDLNAMADKIEEALNAER